MGLMHFPRETVYTFQDLTLSGKVLRVNAEYLFSLHYLLRSLRGTVTFAGGVLYPWPFPASPPLGPHSPDCVQCIQALGFHCCFSFSFPVSLDFCQLLLFVSLHTYTSLPAGSWLALCLLWLLPSFPSVVLISVSGFLFEGREVSWEEEPVAGQLGEGPGQSSGPALKLPALRGGGGLASSAVSRDPASSPPLLQAWAEGRARLLCLQPDPRVNGSPPCLVLGRQGGCSSRLSLSWAPLGPACCTLWILFSYIQLSQKWSFAPPSAFSLLSSGGFTRKEGRTSSS